MSRINRLLNLFRTSQLDRELQEEFQFHLDTRIRDNLAAGMTPEEARQDAVRRFGNQTLARERTHEVDIVRWLESVCQDVKYALRTLRKNPGFTAVAVLSLALGIGANTAIFSLIDAVLLKSLPVASPEHLYLLQPTGRSRNGAFSYPGFEALRDHNQVFSDTFTFSEEGAKWNVILKGQAELTNGQLVTGNYFSALGVNAIAGRAITASDDRESAAPVAVISYAYWKTKFALDASALGSPVIINGVPFTITGVAPPEFFGVSVGYAPEIWIPMAMQPQISQGESLLKASDTWWLLAMARMRPGISRQQAEARLEVVLPLVQKTMGVTAETGLDHFSRIELRPGGTGISALRREFSLPLRILMVVVGIVLLIACVNIANLLLSRASARQREIAIRIAVGGGRLRLIRQFLTESVLLAMIGGALGLLFAFWSGNLLIAFLGSGRLPVVLHLGLDLRVLTFTGAVSFLTGILFGVAPALRATRVDPGPVLKETARGRSGARLTLGKALLVSQVALSLLLLTGTGLFVRTLHNLKNKDLGFNPESVLLMTIEPVLAGYKGPKLTSLYQQVLERINAVPGVRSASLSRFGLIAAGYSGRGVSVPGYTPRAKQDQHVAFNVISPGFFETTGIPLSAGREFGAGDTAAAPRVAVVNAKFARFYFGHESPIGKRFGFLPQVNEQFEIVGIVHDTKYFQLRRESPRMVFVPFLQNSSGPPLERMIIGVRTAANPVSMVSALRREIRSVAKDVPIYNVKTQEQQLNAALVKERLLVTVSGFFSLLALLLTCVGLYGIVAYAVALKTNEIGLRVALGAQYGDVIWLVLRESALLVTIGLGIGIAATLAAARLVSQMLFGVAPNDPATIAACALLLAAVAAFASWLPARRAARLDPLAALRYE